MANPAKRSIPESSSGDTASDASSAGPSGSKRVTPPKAKAKARASATAQARYTPPTARAAKKPSPRWVPVLMFALWGLGLLVIILNYMGVLPGASDGGNGWYLVAGLLSILGGIIVATQYH